MLIVCVVLAINTVWGRFKGFFTTILQVELNYMKQPDWNFWYGYLSEGKLWGIGEGSTCKEGLATTIHPHGIFLKITPPYCITYWSTHNMPNQGRDNWGNDLILWWLTKDSHHSKMLFEVHHTNKHAEWALFSVQDLNIIISVGSYKTELNLTRVDIVSDP